MRGSAYRRYGKRFLDLIGAVLLSVTFFPVLLLVAIVVRIKLGSPIFFKQERLGLDGVTFVIYKFRTMTDERDEKGHLLEEQHRLTRLGRFLRDWSIDEYPQLWNVMRGDMALIGPRPLIAEYATRYSSEQMRRHEVRPGISGWAQVNGRNAISWEQKFILDVWYVDHYSFLVDLKILFLTWLVVLKRTGISHGNHVTMPKWKRRTETEFGEELW
ncbi:sugar transferase [Emcibacter nanhaiensis]|uniref:Sugar transferase n=1 Tax=Emcibacter nanhaiensis TaxID=1505037 RepID=A0A501PK06_9PROT|nr:sugar transferase [Emcibacter nanhaiensis]